MNAYQSTVEPAEDGVPPKTSKLFGHENCPIRIVLFPI
jgi:hypothetical protein